MQTRFWILPAFFLAGCLLAPFSVSPARAQGNFVNITNFTKTANIQTNLIKEFPTGNYVATNALGTPFRIVADGNGKNFNDSGAVTISTSVKSAYHVYTLMNAYAPGSGTVATVEFIGDGGADQVFTLSGSVGIRDFYQGVHANGINGTTTQNAFFISNVQDAGGTGNVNTGLVGNYVVDEQDYALGAAFLSQTLTQIKVNGAGNGTPILLGVTVLSERPGITDIRRSGTNLVVDAFNGLTGETNRLLASTNLALPLAQWQAVATNVLPADGSFSFTLTNAAVTGPPRQFYILKLQ